MFLINFKFVIALKFLTLHMQSILSKTVQLFSRGIWIKQKRVKVTKNKKLKVFRHDQFPCSIKELQKKAKQERSSTVNCVEEPRVPFDCKITSGGEELQNTIAKERDDITSCFEATQDSSSVAVISKKSKKSKTTVPSEKEPKLKRRKNKLNKEATAANSPVPKERKQIQPLLYSSLDEVYNKFLPFILSPDELIANDFPIDSPDQPGFVTNRSCRTPSTHAQRHCNRCGHVFHITNGDEYSSASVCIYHPKRITSLHGVPGAGQYLCCGGNFLAEGCTRRQQHVSSERFLADVHFERVRRKRQVRDGQRYSVYALDCEMSFTTAGMEVTRIGVVGVDGLAVYDTFVLPEHTVLDHCTEFSGVTSRDLERTSTTLADVRAFLLGLLNEDSILVGHALHNDLFALRLIHERIVDTSVVFPHQLGGRRKRSLKSLAEECLGAIIQQEGVGGHDSVEDARTCMELMLSAINHTES